jgi:hypothetical protein
MSATYPTFPKSRRYIQQWLTMNDEVLMKQRGPPGFVGQSNSRHSMYVTCGPRDIISLVTPKLGG